MADTVPNKKLRIRTADGTKEKIVPLEEARAWVYDDPSALVVVENYLVYSFYELADVAAKDRFKDKEILDIYSIEAMEGG